jgi:hypothetical protein
MGKTAHKIKINKTPRNNKAREFSILIVIPINIDTNKIGMRITIGNCV